ncbi:MAG TPA: ABC transporter permease subunit [Phycisphaerales bacterium]|nr:ABC transporter permease subunit [Phycisphaerales bacterium]
MPIILRWFLRLSIQNPIAVRLVQNGSRRTKHLYMRGIYLAVLIAVLLWLILAMSAGSTLNMRELASNAAGAFTKVAYLQIFLICVLSPVFMGGAIAQEANPRTWEVLLTTPMTAAEIVLGNLLGRLFFILALLTCSMPLFALTQYFGGVPGSAILASYLIAGCTATIVGALAIALSVSRLVGKRAFFVFYVAVISYLGITLAIDAGIRQQNMGMGAYGQGVTPMTALNPFLCLKALLNPSTYPKAGPGTQAGPMAWLLETPVQTFCIGSAVLSVLFIAASTVTVRLGGLAMLGVDSSGIPWWRRLLGLKAKGDMHRAPRGVWHNPIAWREAASRNSTPVKIALRWTFLALGLLFGIGITLAYHFEYLESVGRYQFILLATVWGELAVIALVAINTAATAISKEREDGTLDLLLTTPITASAYLQGKLRGLITYLLPLLAVPLVTLLVAGVYSLTGKLDVAGIGPQGGSAAAVLPEAGILATIAIIPFMAFCTMVGLQWSLKSRGTLSSVVWTVGVVGIVAGIMGVCGWNAAHGLENLGVFLGALSPASLIYTLVDAASAAPQTVRNGGVGGVRVWLFFGCLASAGLHAAICYGIHTNMTRTFDMTVRKLAGGR